MRRLTAFLALLACILAAPAAAQLNVIAEYRLGENDGGVVVGGPGSDPTRPGAAGTGLKRYGAPVYGAGGTPRGRISTASMRFDGSTARYEGPVLTMPTDNFGIEAWVRSSNATGNAVIAYNGNSSNSGFGLFRLDGNWGFLYGGVVADGNAPVTSEWTHLAIVRDNGLSRFYVNGTERIQSPATPNAPAGAFHIGGNSLLATEFFNGEIDEVRVFTFAPGTFSPALLNLGERPSAVAVPTITMTGVAVLAMALVLAAVAAVRLRS